MNGKKAKAIRKIAQGATIGLDNVNYVHDGEKGGRVGTVKLGKCTRKLCKILKKKYKQGVQLDEMVTTAG